MAAEATAGTGEKRRHAAAAGRRRRNPPPADQVATPDRVLSSVPALVDLQDVGKRFTPPRSTHSLVQASAKGRFCRVKRVGNRWYATEDDLREFFSGNDATALAPTEKRIEGVREGGLRTPEEQRQWAEGKAVRAATRRGDPEPPPSARQPRAGTSASS